MISSNTLIHPDPGLCFAALEFFSLDQKNEKPHQPAMGSRAQMRKEIMRERMKKKNDIGLIVLRSR